MEDCMNTQDQIKHMNELLSLDKIARLIEQANFGMIVTQVSLTRIKNGANPASHNTTILVDRAYKAWLKSQKQGGG